MESVTSVVVGAQAGDLREGATKLRHRKGLTSSVRCRQLHASDRRWIRDHVAHGCVYLHHGHGGSQPRPVLCTLDTTVEQITCRLRRRGGVLRVLDPNNGPGDVRNGDGLHPHPSEQQGDRWKLLLLSGGSGNQEHSSPISNGSLEENLSTLTHCKTGVPVLSSADNTSLAAACMAQNVELSLDNMDDSLVAAANDANDIRRGPNVHQLSSNVAAVDLSLVNVDDSFVVAANDPLNESLRVHIDGPFLNFPAESMTQDGSPLTNGDGSFALSSHFTADVEGQSSESSQRHCNLPTQDSSYWTTGCDAFANTTVGPRQEHPDSAGMGLTFDFNTGVPPTIYVQLHGESVRRLGSHEKPLEIQNDYLYKLGFKDPWRVQDEGMDPELGCLIRFYIGKPRSIQSSERIQLSGSYDVRKGKMQLPVNRWSRRQVILCGTCLIISSVKDSQAGKMHVLPLLGGKVEEVKKHGHCLAFSSSGPQSQTYYISFDNFTERLRWQRQASKMASQRISSVDLSCCSLEQLPPNLFHSQDVTHLNLKHNFLRDESGLVDLQRFAKLRSLNLSSNHLGKFPLALCSIPTLTELNLSCNRLSSVPAEVADMLSLQTFLLDGNCLRSLPVELGSLPQLTYLGLSFNEFSQVPAALEELSAMERLCMAGNGLTILDLTSLRRLRARHLDLRLNRIRNLVPDKSDFLQHVTNLDLRDNQLYELDASLFPRLEVLHCERNHLVSLKVGGGLLKSLHVSANELSHLEIHPIPTNLTCMDISRNKMERLPDWVCDSRKLEVLDVSRNLIQELPALLLCGGSLRKLLAGYNQLQRLPERLEHTHVEVLDVQHNLLAELPSDLFLKANGLRRLNASANQLESLPPATASEESRSSLQELYLTNNRLTEKCVPLLVGHGCLRVLNLAYNQLQTFPASKMAKLEELEEVDLSGNRLKTLPTTILACRRMHTMLAHSNCLEVFPEVMQLPELKCADLSCNELTEVALPENLPPKLQELDLTGNPRLTLDYKTLEILNNIRCFRMDPPSAAYAAHEGAGTPVVWSYGYAEASGVKNKLCVAALTMNDFGESREALFGVFDGDRNAEIPSLLQCTMSDVLAEQLQHGHSGDDHYMSNTFLVMQRKLGTAGQKLGGSAALCHIRHQPLEPSGCFTLTAANVGKCQALLCRDGKPLPLSALHNVGVAEEYHRVRLNKAIVTEENKVNGVTDCTRILGYSFLYPSVTALPHVQTVTLTARDDFFLLLSRGVCESVPAAEAVEAVRGVADATAAAKKLCALAQGYGCAGSVSAVVVQLSVTGDCCGRGDLAPPSPFPPSMATPSLSASEVSSEVSASEMSSESGSTASDEPPTRGPALSHAPPPAPFHRQLSSDNGLDSEDEEPIAGVFSNGSRLEVEAEVHPPLGKGAGLTSSTGTLSRVGTLGRKGGGGGNGSVALPERSHNLIEVACDAPARKQGGYFTAPAQPDPDDRFIVPPELEHEVQELMKQQQPADCYDTQL